MLPVLAAIALVFGFMVASGNWVGASAVLGGVTGLAVLLAGPRTVLILWLAGSPTFFVFLNNYMHAVPVLTMERLLFALLVAMALARIAWSKMAPIPLIPAERWMFGFLGVALVCMVPAFLSRPLSVVVSQDAALYLQTYLMPFAAFMLARRLPWSERDAEKLGCWLLAAGMVLFVTAILQVFFGVMTFVPTYMDVIHSAERATGVFNNATEFGMVMNVFFLVALLFVVRAKDGMLRLLLLMVAAAMFAGVLLSGTRATWAGLAASLVFLYFADRRLRPYLALCAGLATVAAIFALPLLIETEIFQKRIGDIGPILNRLAGWATAFNMVLHNPFGVGFERAAFGIHMREYLVGLGPASAQFATVIDVPHNEHLNVAVLTGLIGFVLYVGVYYSLFAMLRRICREHALGDISYDATIYVAAMLTSYLVNGVFVDFGSNIYVGVLLFACMGLVASSWRVPARQGRKHEGHMDSSILAHG